MTKQNLPTDVVIIGGGLAGLTAAAYLARAGVAVTLYEKSTGLGGRASTQIHDGYSFNRGVHAFYTGDAGSQVLAELGISYSGHSPTDLYVLHRGKLHLAPINLSTVMQTNVLGLTDKMELLRIFSGITKLKPQELRTVSIEQWLDRTIKHPKVRQFFDATARTFVYSPALNLVSADVFVRKLQISLNNPVIYLDGGWQTLVDGLRNKAEQAGARIMNGTHLEEVEHQDGRVTGVRLRDGSSVQASVVIIATPPREALKLVDGGNYQPLCQIIDALIPARVADLDVALSRLPDPRYHVVQDLDSPRFMSIQSLHSHVAPEGGALIYTFKQLDPEHPSDPREDERDLENLLDIVQPGWREVLVKRTFLPHIEAIGMLPTVRDGGYAGRPGPKVPGLSNLYMVGDWIGEGFLSDPCFGSARQVVQMILQKGSLPTQNVAGIG